MSQILDDGQSPKHSQCQNRAVQEWSIQQVSHWLMSLNFEQYVSEFTAQNINGEHLLQLDGSKLKVMDCLGDKLQMLFIVTRDILREKENSLGVQKRMVYRMKTDYNNRHGTEGQSITRII